MEKRSKVEITACSGRGESPVAEEDVGGVGRGTRNESGRTWVVSRKGDDRNGDRVGARVRMEEDGGRHVYDSSMSAGCMI